ncbi:unnamed protein product [Adineta steineri]|uniref:Copper transport protein n=1 Tax=Adineta steineri TaxID=433720 RepID=A0A815ZLH2_9BILA|nr:unnamed protein product [Adineta steineri]CAF1585020.1 unnamed protein product [Adineta steineri]
MTYNFKCYQNNFLFNNLNITSFGDCFGSVIACMSFALLIELSRGIDLYLRNYSVTGNHPRSHSSLNQLSEKTIRKRRFGLHIVRTLVRLVQTALSYILMLMVMNNFVGFLFSAVIALGIGYYLLNGVHPYTRSANHVHISNANSEITNPTDITNENEEILQEPVTTSPNTRTLHINT